MGQYAQGLIRTFLMGEICFEVYCAKQLHTLQWTSSTLQKLVMQARLSYLRYGPVPLYDAYDHKAAIYLVRASDLKDPANEEWISLRFVPSDNRPLYTEDTLSILCEGTQLASWLKNTQSAMCGNNLENIVTLSRLSGIHNKKEKITFESKFTYTGICFALMIMAFIKQCRTSLLPYNFFTAILRDELVDKALTITLDGGKKQLPYFPYAYEMLGLESKHALRLDRSFHDFQAYRYPSYFLNMRDIHKTLIKLFKDGFLTQAAFAPILPTQSDPDCWMDYSVFSHMAPRLGELLCMTRIEGSKITGDELREILDTSVDDGVYLRMMERHTLLRSIKEYLRIQGIYKKP